MNDNYDECFDISEIITLCSCLLDEEPYNFEFNEESYKIETTVRNATVVLLAVDNNPNLPLCLPYCS